MFSALSVAGGTDTERSSGSPSSVATMSTTTAEEWNEVCHRPAPLHSDAAPSEASSWSQVSEPLQVVNGSENAVEVSEPPHSGNALEVSSELASELDPLERRHRELMMRLDALQDGIEALCRDVRRR